MKDMSVEEQENPLVMAEAGFRMEFRLFRFNSKPNFLSSAPGHDAKSL